MTVGGKEYTDVVHTNIRNSDNSNTGTEHYIANGVGVIKIVSPNGVTVSELVSFEKGEE